MLILGLMLPLFLGYAITLVLVPRLTLYERLALGYGLGFGFLTLGMFFLNVLGMSFSLRSTVVLVCAIIAISLIWGAKKTRFIGEGMRGLRAFVDRKKSTIPLCLFEKALFGLIIFFLITDVILGVYWPVGWPDAVTLYDFRAKLLTGTLSFSKAASLKIAAPNYVLASRPPMTSLVHTWLYLWGWENAKIFYPLCLVALALVFYFSLKDYVPRYHSLLFILILITTPIIYSYSHHAYLNFPLTFYFSVGTLYLYRWIFEQRKGFLSLAGIFLGLSSWIRSDSLIFFVGYFIILMYFSLSRRKYLALFVFAIPYFLLAPLWGIYAREVFHYRPGVPQMAFLSQGLISHLKSIWNDYQTFFDMVLWRRVMEFLWTYIFVRFKLILGPLVLVIFLYGGRIRKHRFLFFIVLSNIGLFILGTYRYLTVTSHWHIWGSSERIFMITLPVIYYFIALITAEPNLSLKE